MKVQLDSIVKIDLRDFVETQSSDGGSPSQTCRSNSQGANDAIDHLLLCKLAF